MLLRSLITSTLRIGFGVSSTILGRAPAAGGGSSTSFSLTIPVAGTFTLAAAGNATGVTVTGLGSSANGFNGSVSAPGTGSGAGALASTLVAAINSGATSTANIDSAGNGNYTSFDLTTPSSVSVISVAGSFDNNGGDAANCVGDTKRSGGAGGAAGVGGGGGGGEAPTAAADGNAGSAGGVLLGGAGGTGGAGADGGAGGDFRDNVGLPGTGSGAGGGGGSISTGTTAGGAGQPGSITITGTTASAGLPFNCTTPDVSTQPLLIKSITSGAGAKALITTVGPHGIVLSGTAAVSGTSVGGYNTGHACTVASTTTLLSANDFISAIGDANTNTALTAVGSFTYTVGA